MQPSSQTTCFLPKGLSMNVAWPESLAGHGGQSKTSLTLLLSEFAYDVASLGGKQPRNPLALDLRSFAMLERIGKIVSEPTSPWDNEPQGPNTTIPCLSVWSCPAPCKLAPDLRELLSMLSSELI